MAAREAYDWPRSPPLIPDTASPVYPDRPIRPLPKRRLRDRLSGDDADLMLPQEPTQQSLFSFPYAQADKETAGAGKLRGGDRRNDHTCADCAHVHEDHSDMESEEEESTRHLYPPHLSHAGYDGAGGSRSNPPPPDSTASSADGYESFENTNNKKKRKIPQSNGLGAHGHHTINSTDGSTLGGGGRDDSAPLDDSGPAVGSYYGSGSAVMPSPSAGAGVSVSGAGRGRYGRPRGTMDRRPLGASTNGMNAPAGRVRTSSYGSGKGAAQGQPQGIISAAIANAAQQAPLTPEHGNENVSLLQQQASKSPPQKTDFTFQSDAVSKFAWPGPQQTDLAAAQSMGAHGAGTARGGLQTQATQTSPNVNGGQNPRGAGAQGQHPPQQYAGQQRPGNMATPNQEKPRKPRRVGRILEINARRRRIQQEYQNFHSPPRREDVWICEFCEYEDIFGMPPRALIRRYEERDRAEQKRIAEKRRLLEKAKAKSRKGKKGSKNAKPNNQAAATQNQRYDAPDDYANDDDYYEDDYIDDDQMSIPATPQPGQAPGAYPTAAAVPPAKHISQAAAGNPMLPPLHLQKGHPGGAVLPPERSSPA